MKSKIAHLILVTVVSLLASGYASARDDCPDPYDDYDCFTYDMNVCIKYGFPNRNPRIECTGSSSADFFMAVWDSDDEPYIWGWIYNSNYKFCCDSTDLGTNNLDLYIYSYAGNDTVCLGTDGEAATNCSQVGAGNEDWEGGSYIYLAGGTDRMLGSSNSVDYVDGGDGNDYVYGRGLADEIYGQAGDDHLYGEGSDDFIRGGRDDDYVYGDDGNDDLFGDQQDDHVYGGDGDDNIDLGTGNDDGFGQDGDDCLCDWLDTAGGYTSDSYKDYLYGGIGDTDTCWGNEGSADWDVFNNCEVEESTVGEQCACFD